MVIVDGVLRDEYDAFRSVIERIGSAHVVTAGVRRGSHGGPGGPVMADLAFDEIDRSDEVDVLVVPGSLGCRRAADDPAVRSALRRLSHAAGWVLASSTGSVLLAAAGVVHDESVATHWLATDLLGSYGCTAAPGRVVTNGRIVTCSGALSALDGALLLADRIEGDGTADRIRAELLAAGEHHLRPAPWWRHRSRRRVPGGRAPIAAPTPPPTPLSVMIELVDDPETVERLRRNAARRQRRSR
jgi:transcriptional regulator GlxA family with amidase domain